MKWLLLFSLSAFFLIPYSTWAQEGSSCKVTGDEALNYGASLENNETYQFVDKIVSGDSKPEIFINYCEEEGNDGRYLQLGFGGQDYSVETSTIDVSYTDIIDDDECRIKTGDNRGTINTYDKRLEFFKKQDNFLKQCTRYKITQTSQYPLTYPQDQEHCEIEKIDENSAWVTGGACFFQIFPDAFYSINFDIRDKCAKENFLKEQDIAAGDYSSKMVISTVGDPAGQGDDLDLVNSRTVNFHIEPKHEDLPLSGNWVGDLPRYPSNYELSNLELAQPRLYPHGAQVSITAPLFVDHKCRKKCQDESCTSSCHYFQPLSGEYILYEKVDGKYHYLTSWWSGGILPPKYKGIVAPSNPGATFKRPAPDEDKTYRLVFLIKDPKFDYQMLQKSIDPALLPFPGLPGGDFESQMSSGIPDSPASGQMPQLPSINDAADERDLRLGSHTAGGSLSLSETQYWPPFYDAVCAGPKGSDCMDPGGELIKLTLDFRFKSPQQTDDDTDGDEDENEDSLIEVIKTSRSGPVLPSYSRETDLLPHAWCPSNDGDDQPPNNGDDFDDDFDDDDFDDDDFDDDDFDDLDGGENHRTKISSSLGE